MAITINGGVQFTGGFTSIDSPALSINTSGTIELRDQSTMTTTTYNFTDIVNFTRASSATYTGSDGLIKVTPASVNLLTYTQEFDNAVWAKNAATVIANSITAPNGTTTADTLTAMSGVATMPYVVNSNSPTTTVTSSVYTTSMYVKAGTYTYVQIFVNNQSTEWTNFTLTGNGTATANGSSTASIQASVNGWYRISFTYTASGTDRRPCFMLGASASATRAQPWNPTGTESIYIWGAQLEVGSSVTTYTRNYGSVYPPRFDYDPVTLQPKGLLIEEARTNLLTYSEQFDNAAWTKANATITTNATVASDGTTTADKIIPNAGVEGEMYRVGTSAAGTVTYSIYLKEAEWRYVRLVFGSGYSPSTGAWVDLRTATITSGSEWAAVIVGNGWVRVTGTATYSGTGDSYIYLKPTNASAYPYTTGDGTSGIYIWGAQLETGAFATSYIPTTVSTATRAADVATMTGANFSSWYNQSEGTLVVNGDAHFPPSSRYFVAGTTSQRFSYGTSGGSLGTYDGTNAATVAGGISGNTFKLATSYSTTDGLAASLNGSAVSTSASYSGTFSTATAIGLWNLSSGTAPTTGHIRSITYYPYRLTNAQLQALTI